MSRLVAVQFKARATVSEGLRFIDFALADVRADLIVLPEMAFSGYGFPNPAAVHAVAEPADGPTGRMLGALARRCGSWVVAGFPELAGDALFNAALVIDPTGLTRFVYRKTLLFDADHWARPGDSGYPVIDTSFGRLGVGICMDLNDDRFLAHAASEELDLIAFPTNWIQEEGRVWDYWRDRLVRGWPEEFQVEHAQPNRARVHALLVAANSYGREGDYELRGESAILDVCRIHAAAGPTDDGLLRVDWSGRG